MVDLPHRSMNWSCISLGQRTGYWAGGILRPAPSKDPPTWCYQTDGLGASKRIPPRRFRRVHFKALVVQAVGFFWYLLLSCLRRKTSMKKEVIEDMCVWRRPSIRSLSTGWETGVCNWKLLLGVIHGVRIVSDPKIQRQLFKYTHEIYNKSLNCCEGRPRSINYGHWMRTQCSGHDSLNYGP